MSKIRFNKPYIPESSYTYIKEVLDRGWIAGDHIFTQKCSAMLSDICQAAHVLMTTSGTHALEMSAILADLGPNDEFIAPSYTFSSTINALLLRGAKPIFVDIDPKTMNIDPVCAAKAVTDRAKVIIMMHYAGVSCDVEAITQIAKEHDLRIIEDAAQALGGSYKSRPLGCLGDFAAISFHETKNFTSGEGGALLFSKSEYKASAEIIREKGTDRSKYFRGEIDKYTWQGMGSSYLPSELNMALLYSQLEQFSDIINNRRAKWDLYNAELKQLAAEYITLPYVPNYARHNAHIFYIKTRDLAERTRLAAYLREHGIEAFFHYVPLHSSPAGRKYGTFVGDDVYTTVESERILRLPIYYQIPDEDILCVCDAIRQFYS